MPTDTNQTIQDSRKAAMSFLDAAKKREEDRNNRNATYSRGGTRRKLGTVEGFLSAGRRNEARAAAAQKGGDTDFDLADRIRRMSDEDFDKAVASGELTPDQIRRAGEYDWDVYMGDVWMEGDNPDRFPVEPTYDEFMSDPAKYGYERGINEETDRAFDRYAKYLNK
jgi:hypothetical protein